MEQLGIRIENHPEQLSNLRMRYEFDGSLNNDYLFEYISWHINNRTVFLRNKEGGLTDFKLKIKQLEGCNFLRPPFNTPEKQRELKKDIDHAKTKIKEKFIQSENARFCSAWVKVPAAFSYFYTILLNNKSQLFSEKLWDSDPDAKEKNFEIIADYYEAIAQYRIRIFKQLILSGKKDVKKFLRNNAHLLEGLAVEIKKNDTPIKGSVFSVAKDFIEIKIESNAIERIKTRDITFIKARIYFNTLGNVVIDRLGKDGHWAPFYYGLDKGEGEAAIFDSSDGARFIHDFFLIYSVLFQPHKEEVLKEDKLNQLVECVKKSKFNNTIEIKVILDNGQLLFTFLKRDITFLNNNLAPLFKLDVYEDGVLKLDKKQIMVSSIHVRKALLAASECWQNPSIFNILLSAPPGSGKEVLSDYIASGYANKSIKIFLPRFKGDDLIETLQIHKKLSSFFGDLDEDSGRILIEKGCIIFDEADKTGEHTRGTLLRMMEQKEIEVCESTLQHIEGIVETLLGNEDFGEKIKDILESKNGISDVLKKNELLKLVAKRIDKALKKGKIRNNSSGTISFSEFTIDKIDIKDMLLIFNVSKPMKILILEQAPADFWTRIQKYIEIPHPFDIPDEVQAKEVLQHYLMMFIHMTVNNYSKTSELGKRVSLYINFSASKNIEMLSIKMSMALLPLIRVSLPSIRIIRTLVERTISELLTTLIGLSGNLPPETQSRGMIVRTNDSMEFEEQWLTDWCLHNIPAFFLEQIK